MRKIGFTLLILLSLLAVFANPVRALDGLITLVETRNDPGGGVIFVFSFTGEFPDSYFKGFVTVGDEKYPIDCNVVGDGLVQCTTSRATAGKNVVVFLGEFVFWTFVPEGGFLPGPTQYCYDVYDALYDENEESHFWTVIDQHCQDAPANYGDTIDIGSFYLFEFMAGSPSCFDPVIGDAYYGMCPQ